MSIEPGLLVLHRHTGVNETWLTIEQADPVVEFNHNILEDIKLGRDTGYIPDCRVEGFEQYGPHICNQATCSPERTCYAGIYVHVDARDRHVVYRIDRYQPARDSWIGRWPD